MNDHTQHNNVRYRVAQYVSFLASVSTLPFIHGSRQGNVSNIYGLEDIVQTRAQGWSWITILERGDGHAQSVRGSNL
jgi:hypothetical protein